MNSRLTGEFLATLAHDLRSPLNSILGFTEFLLDEKPGPLNARQKEYLQGILVSSHRMLQLVDNVADRSKVEAGKMQATTPATTPEGAQ